MNYIKEVLGIDVIYEKGSVNGLPNFIREKYRIQKAKLSGFPVVFVFPKGSLERFASLQKQLKRIEQVTKRTAVLVSERLSSQQKRLLLREKISFVVEGRQIYLPFLALYLQQRCDPEEETSEKFLPSTQLLFLYFIYRGAKELHAKEAAQALLLTKTSISRGEKQLVASGLLRIKRIGREKILCADLPPKEIFEKARPMLLNPVKQVVYLKESLLEKGLLKSGLSALSEHSMLNEDEVACFACTSISAYGKEATRALLDEKEQVKVEFWRYDSKKLGREETVDPLSLALCFKDCRDERIEEAVEATLKKAWEDIGGQRN